MITLIYWIIGIVLSFIFGTIMGYYHHKYFSDSSGYYSKHWNYMSDKDKEKDMDNNEIDKFVEFINKEN